MATKTKASPTTVAVTLAQFDSQDPFDIMREAVPVGEFTPLTLADYSPRGMTPLRDACAQLIGHLDKQQHEGHVAIGVLLDRSGSMQGNEASVVQGVNEFVGGMAETKPDPKAGGKVLCVVVTDGLENASREVSQEALAAMTREREAEGWTFIYLGANQDAWGTGASLGLSGGASGQSVNYASTPKGMRSALSDVRRRGVGYVGEHDTYMASASAESKSSITEDGELLTDNVSGDALLSGKTPGVHEPEPEPKVSSYGDVGAALRKARGEEGDS